MPLSFCCFRFDLVQRIQHQRHHPVLVRHLQEQLHRSQERSRTVKNVLGPVLGAAAARFRKVVKYATPTSASIYQKQGHMWDTGACDGNGNASWIMAGDQRRNAEDIVQEVKILFFISSIPNLLSMSSYR